MATTSIQTVMSQYVPVKLVIPTLDVMVELLGQHSDLKNFRQNFLSVKQPFVEPHIEYALFSTLIEYLEQIEQYPEHDWITDPVDCPA